MGLDQFLYRNRPTKTTDVSAETVGALEEVAYWRKHSQIQTFFASENCEMIDVPLAQLKDLQQRVNTLLKYEVEFPNQPLQVRQIAALDLPTSSGFFWGSPDYNARYWAQLDHTSEQLAYVLNTHQDGDTYSYCGDW